MFRLIPLLLALALPAAADVVLILESGDSNPKRVKAVHQSMPAELCETYSSTDCIVNPDLSGVAGKRESLWCSDNGTIRACTLAELDAKGHTLDADAMIDAILTDYCTQINVGTVAECRNRVRSAAAE